MVTFSPGGAGRIMAGNCDVAAQIDRDIVWRGELWRGTVTWRHRQTEILCGLAEKWEESQRDHGDYDINEMDTKFAKMFAN